MGRSCPWQVLGGERNRPRRRNAAGTECGDGGRARQISPRKAGRSYAAGRRKRTGNENPTMAIHRNVVGVTTNVAGDRRPRRTVPTHQVADRQAVTKQRAGGDHVAIGQLGEQFRVPVSAGSSATKDDPVHRTIEE